jgi:SapC
MRGRAGFPADNRAREYVNDEGNIDKALPSPHIGEIADALRRISLAWRSSRISRSSSFILAAMSVLTPGRSPLSTWLRLTHSCNVPAEQPILAAIETIAFHCDACSPRCSLTIRIARSRTSGDWNSRAAQMSVLSVSYPWLYPSQVLEPPANPARFILPIRLDGLYTISRAKLAYLDDSAILDLHQSGYLGSIHAIANSLAQIVRLQQLHNAHAQRNSNMPSLQNISVGLPD